MIRCSDTGDHSSHKTFQEPVLKRIRSDNYQIGFIYSAAGVYPVEDVGSAELREWTEDVCSH